MNSCLTSVLRPAASTLRSPVLRQTRCLSTLPQTSFQDPSRPGLYYHLLNRRAVPVYAVSFLKDAPVVEDSKTVVGWLPAVASGAAPTSESGESDAQAEAGLQDFVPNESFVKILHSSIRSALQKGRDESIKNEALQRESGWMHVNDSRNIPALGRVGDPDDIIGTVLVENGQVVASTYQEMPSYRVCTSDGVTQLSEGLNEELLEELTSVYKQEASSSK